MPHKVDKRVYREIGAWLDADFAAHGERRDILKFGMAFYKKNLVVCRDL